MPPTLTILHEDEFLLFIDKPAGIVVQRGYDQEEPILLDLVRDYLGAKGEETCLLQRLDRGTTGVIFFSKSSKMNVRLTRQFETKRIRKIYAAFCVGRLAEPQLVDAPLARIGAINFGVRDEGKRALTRIIPLEPGDAHSLVEIHLLTGRTHQIRVHLSAIGHPLVGDWLYGDRDRGRPMLHARRIEMIHPATGQPLVVESRLPEDFEAMRRG
ncbi:MAG: RluA family pseudouridine synthase [Thermoanaerobaculia bacterium]|nr:RluA family pseudouridine synthase [Thermoanaerobaculia bacterium]